MRKHSSATCIIFSADCHQILIWFVACAGSTQNSAGCHQILIWFVACSGNTQKVPTTTASGAGTGTGTCPPAARGSQGGVIGMRHGRSLSAYHAFSTSTVCGGSAYFGWPSMPMTLHPQRKLPPEKTLFGEILGDGLLGVPSGGFFFAF